MVEDILHSEGEAQMGNLPEPIIPKGTFVADTARVVGEVSLREQTNVWFGAVIRGDMAPITVGSGASIQDNAVIHSQEDLPVFIGDDVVIGHSAILHGCTVHNGALIGMGAIVLDSAEIGEGAMVGAGALVPPGAKIPPRTLALGSPARVVRDLRPEEVAGVADAARRYRELMKEYMW